jgi:hypothetical protein
MSCSTVAFLLSLSRREGSERDIRILLSFFLKSTCLVSTKRENATVDIISVRALMEQEQFSATCGMNLIGIDHFDGLFDIAKQKSSKDSDLRDCLYR